MLYGSATKGDLSIGFVGFGEVGRHFAENVLTTQEELYIYDPFLDKSVLDQYGNKVKSVETTSILSENCNVFFLLVGSSVAIKVTDEITSSIQKESIFIDFTTSSPLVKEQNKDKVETRGAYYIDAAIMGTVATQGSKVPILLSGNRVAEVNSLLNSIGFDGNYLDRDAGAAASIKLIRSIFMKGLEALTIEALTTAQYYGVRQEVMNSIATTLDNNKFEEFANALIQTHVIHKERRLKEVNDSEKLIKEAGLNSFVTEGVLEFFENSVNRVNISEEKVEIDDILQTYIITSNN
ncbi:dehydrogenase [Shouchella clausii]|uniref:NAD(P)-binding domain-containing protein n=1 Tax=Shouchella clausii TaxID=79880 RepID=UPI001B07FDA5|nr:NAD(P)-binding domain-containing protein [Shouchella clausii]GIN15720.1 dehydrogenase [Shouchella clausii]